MKEKLSLKILLREMRIKSWLKNLFVFFPIVFSLSLFEWNKLIQVITLCLSFCFISSAIYILNDICDVEKDRLHAVKKNRPIASGQIPIPMAWGMLFLLAAAGLLTAISVNLHSLLLILVYVVINILYSKWLKNRALIDCFCIAAGFVLRVLVGGTIVENGVSDWMFLTVVSMSLFMAFGKRRGELINYKESGTRNVLDSYQLSFLDGAVFLCAGLTIAFYSLWSMSHASNLVYTVPIVLFLVIRYLQLVFSGCEEADPTTMILSDKTLLISCALCGLVMIALLYGNQIS